VWTTPVETDVKFKVINKKEPQLIFNKLKNKELQFCKNIELLGHSNVSSIGKQWNFLPSMTELTYLRNKVAYVSFSEL